MMEIMMGDRSYKVSHTDCLKDVWTHIESDKPKWCMFDYETTGLHIKKDVPTIGAFGWTGKVFVFPTTKENLEEVVKLSNFVGMVFNHNINYDIHMAANIVEDDLHAFRFKRYGDTMGLCRAVFESLSVREGGDSLKLKVIGKKYIDPQADRYEKAVKLWMSQKRTMDRKVLSAMLRPLGWGLKRLEEAMNKGSETIPDEVMGIFHEWRTAYPEPTYADVPLEIITPYVASDIMLVDILVQMAMPVVEFRKQWHIVNKEFDLLPIVWEMERQGIEVDRDYLLDANERMEDLIANLQTQMYEIAQREFSVGQHSVIKEIYEERNGVRPNSTDKQFLKKQESEGDELAPIIRRLRRLEKWKETYIERILQVSEYDGKFYTSMNQFNPVSGRFSGDAQQFPKDAIYDDEGNEIYNPRRAFKMRGYYLDFSQVELRVQAHYTLYYGGDINLCRAYMPFKCVHYETGEIYDYTTEEGRARWNEMKPGAPVKEKHWEDLLKEGWSVWILPETGETWTPTDVHSSTTERALRAMGYNLDEMDEKTFKWWRGIGKTFNFMRNYGGGNKKAAEILDIPIEQAEALNRGYTDAFPVVVQYQKGTEASMRKYGYVANMYGRRYYVNNPNRFYTVANYLIQGTCADDLKEKMIKIHKFIKENNLKMRMVLCVHDEIQFSVPDPSEDWAIWEIKKIMEHTPKIQVPIVADVEFTETYWSNKKVVLK